jgi:O-antigen ligase
MSGRRARCESSTTGAAEGQLARASGTLLVVAASIQAGPAGAISDRAAMGAARALRILSTVLLVGLALIIAGSVLAFGSVYRFTHKPLFYATGVVAVVALARAGTVLYLRRRLGRSRFAFHTSGRWLVLDVENPYGIRTWSYDLDRPLLPVPPLALPGLLFLVWVVIQMVPLPASVADALSGAERLPGVDVESRWRTVTVASDQTARGLTFLCWALVLHLVGGVALARREDQQRFRRFVAVLGLLLGVMGLVQMATGTKRIYGFFEPDQGGDFIFGPFVNRDHFAFYMLMVVPIALGLFAEAYRRFRRLVGSRANLRRQMVTLSSPPGLAMIYACVPALAAVASLVATTSRGALLAFVGSMAVASFLMLRRHATAAGGVVLVVILAVLAWFGVARIQYRMQQAASDATGRTVVWTDTLERMGGRWIAGSGLNTFDRAMSGATAWALPEGASPWSGEESSFAGLPYAGYRFIVDAPGGWFWYGQAHNDYVQILAETGAVGLLLLFWAIWRVLGTVRSDPWLLAALVGPLLHAFLDFGFQFPAIVALFVTLAAVRPSLATA